MSQNSTDSPRMRRESMSGCLVWVAEGEHGVGGWAGIKNEGIVATEDYTVQSMRSSKRQVKEAYDNRNI